MKAQGLARIGRDCEIRYLQNGDAVANLSLAFSYGRKGEDGKRPTQWLEGAMYGKRLESLAPYLLKGSQVVVYLDDVHIETYEGKNGTGTKLVGRISDVELVAGGQQQAAPQRPAPPKPPVRQAAAPAQGGFDMDDDVPF